MRKMICAFLACMAVVLLCSCGDAPAAESVAPSPSPTPVICDTPASLVPFYSLEEFIDAAKSISSEKDIAALASLEVFETDGHLAYSCFYSAQSVALWEVVYENDRPAGLRLLDDDINN